MGNYKDKQKTENWKRSFFTIWTGQAFSLFGSSLVQFALIWWLTESTGSAMVLAAASIMGVLPEFLLGPFVGALVDRWNRKRVMIFADIFIAAATLLLVLLFLTGLVQTWHIFVILFIRSLGNCFHWPAMMATTSLMVPDEHLARIAGINQALRGALNIVGPPLGAMLLELIPFYTILAIDVVTALLAVIPLFFVLIPQPQRELKGELVNIKIILSDVKEGFKYVISWPGLLGVIILAVILNGLISPAFMLLPLLITDHFQGGAWHLGAIESAEGLGVIAGGLILGVWGGFRKRIVTAMFGTIGMGIAILVAGVTPANMFWMGMVALFVSGFMNTIQNANFFSILQARIDPLLQGRVLTIVQSAVVGILLPGYLIAGQVVEWVGIQPFYIVAGVSAVIGGLAGMFIPVIANIEENFD